MCLGPLDADTVRTSKLGWVPDGIVEQKGGRGTGSLEEILHFSRVKIVSFEL